MTLILTIYFVLISILLKNTEYVLSISLKFESGLVASLLINYQLPTIITILSNSLVYTTHKSYNAIDHADKLCLPTEHRRRLRSLQNLQCSSDS